MYYCLVGYYEMYFFKFNKSDSSYFFYYKAFFKTNLIRRGICNILG